MKLIIPFLSLLMLSQLVCAGTLPLNPLLVVYEDGFSSPVAVRNAGDSSNRLFVVQQGGIISVIDAGGNALATPFLDISSLTQGSGERGLLGLAFHPNYTSNGFFYINYTNLNHDTTIARYQVSGGDPNIANSASSLILITIDQDFSNHNGGDVNFGADGYLYVGMGDGGGAGDSCSRGQTIDPDDLDNGGDCAADTNFLGAGGNSDSRALLGAMLRIDVDNPGMNVGDACGEGVNYGIPADNPFTGMGDGACDEIWSSGLRNPYRFSFDRDTGDMFIADVGQNRVEEIDFESAASLGGINFGWDCREGSTDYTKGDPDDPDGPAAACAANPVTVDPINEYANAGGRCSVTGGYRYRGPEFTWTGTYIYADFCSGELFYTQFLMGSWTSFAVLTSTGSSVSGFGEDEQGNLYYTNFNGQVVQIIDDDFPGELVFEDGFES